MASSPEIQPATGRNGVVQFGAFELNRSAGELRKQGSRIRLQPKPMRMLCALLERPGEIVTRDELKARLWPDDTFVDFESGLNTAVNRLRFALGDSAEHPRYIETEARSGYRFIAPAQVKAEPAAPPPAQAFELKPITLEATSQRRRFRCQLAGVVGVLAIAGVAAVAWRFPGPQVTFRQITFRRGQVSGARFAECSRSILFTTQ